MILVTGASGYLGSALWSALERQGLVCISAGRTGADRFFDLNDACPSEDLLAGVSTVVHCAGLAHNRGAEAEYQRLNVEGALGLAKAAIRAKVVRFIHISSLNVVPASAEGPNLPAAALPAARKAVARYAAPSHRAAPAPPWDAYGVPQAAGAAAARPRSAPSTKPSAGSCSAPELT